MFPSRAFATATIAALAFAAPLSAQESAGHDSNIVEIAAAAGSFTTLLAAAEAAGLVEVLQSEGPFTVFAPTDDAFAALPEGTIEALLADPDALREILTYHVVPDRVLSSDVIGLSSAETVQGTSISIALEGETVVLNGSANVIAVDVEASNGVIHVIDAVILPGN